MATEPKPTQDSAAAANGFFWYDKIGELPPGWKLPTHLDLPESDGMPVENFSENPQGALIFESLTPILERRHPDGQYCVGQNSGIYWQLSSPPLKGAIVPDWFYVPDVSPMLEGEYRRSYVLWQEKKPPLLVLEFVSQSGEKERDDTPLEGKFWIYEQAVQAKYYGIFDSKTETLELYLLDQGKFQRVAENDRGHCPIPELGIELGIWEGTFRNMTIPWLRVWDLQGVLLPHAQEYIQQQAEQVEQEKLRAEQEKQRAEQEKQRADTLAAQLRALGIDPDKT